MKHNQPELDKLDKILIDIPVVLMGIKAKDIIPDCLVAQVLVEAKQAILALIEKEKIEAKNQFHNHYSGEPIKHPVPCEDCGSDYWMDWLLPHPVFNAICPGGNGYLCLPCFAKRMELKPTGSKSKKEGKDE